MRAKGLFHLCSILTCMLHAIDRKLINYIGCVTTTLDALKKTERGRKKLAVTMNKLTIKQQSMILNIAEMSVRKNVENWLPQQKWQ